MKRLFLIRHAKSSWDHPELRDIDRPLNEQGLHAAPLVKKAMKERNYQPDQIFLSPSKRTRMTTELLFPEESTEVIDSFYGATPGCIVHFLRELPNEIQAPALIGHNPTWIDLHLRLLGKPLAKLPTCGIIVMNFQCDHWSSFGDQPGELVDIIIPKHLS